MKCFAPFFNFSRLSSELLRGIFQNVPQYSFELSRANFSLVPTNQKNSPDDFAKQSGLFSKIVGEKGRTPTLPKVARS